MEQLQFLCDNPKPNLKIYNYAVFSIFAASNDPKYRASEPGGGRGDHMPLILQERELLGKLVAQEHTQFKLLLWPPLPDPGHTIRYQTFIRWLQNEGSRPNIQVRCTSYYRSNRLIIPGEFAIEATYAPKEGWSRNTVYYNEDEINRLVEEFEETFEHRAHPKTKEEVLKYLEEQARQSENAKLSKQTR